MLLQEGITNDNEKYSKGNQKAALQTLGYPEGEEGERNDIMKIEIDTDDLELIEKYSRPDGHRDWGKRVDTWLHQGEIVVIIGGESADKLRAEIEGKGASR